MINIDPTLLIPVALQDLIRQQEASFGLAVNGQQLIIKVEQKGTRRVLWSVEICDQPSIPGWYVNRYMSVPEYRHRGIATEFYERLIQQAEQARIQYLTIYCPVANAPFFAQMFGAVQVEQILPEKREAALGHGGTDDASQDIYCSMVYSVTVRHPDHIPPLAYASSQR